MIRRVIISIVLLFFVATCAYCADMIMVDSSGSAVISPTQVMQKVRVRYSPFSLTFMDVMALDAFVTNTDNPAIKIPISNLYLTRDSSALSIQLALNIVLSIIPSISLGGTNVDEMMTLTLKNIGMLPAGHYSTRVLFRLTTGLIPQVYEYIYTWNFEVLKDLSISSPQSGSQITLNQNDTLNLNSNVLNNAPTQLNISANLPWAVYLNTNNIGTLNGDYYFQVKSVAGNATINSSAKTKIQSNQKYTLATGTQTSSNIPYGQYLPTNIVVEYSRIHTGTSFMLPATYTNPIRYTIEEPTR